MGVKLKVVVFGGSGFIGSHLADALSDEGHEVLLFDLKPSAYLRSDQRMYVGDILNPEQVREAVKGHDAVYNFAGIADLDDARTQAAQTVAQNVLGTVNLLDASREMGVERYIHASSIYVYSNRGGFYRCSKQAAELYIEEYQKQYGLNYVIFRFGTIFGTRADERNSVHRYLRQALSEKRIESLVAGDEVREYVNVKDATRLCVHVLDENPANQHLIITGPYPMRTKEFLEMINEIVGGGVELRFDENGASGHYRMTPYTFEPKIGRKLVANKYMDMGGGLLECLREIYEDMQAASSGKAAASTDPSRLSPSCSRPQAGGSE